MVDRATQVSHRLAAGVGPATGLGIPGRSYLSSHWPDDNMLPKCGSTGRTASSLDSKGKATCVDAAIYRGCSGSAQRPTPWDAGILPVGRSQYVQDRHDHRRRGGLGGNPCEPRGHRPRRRLPATANAWWNCESALVLVVELSGAFHARTAISACGTASCGAVSGGPHPRAFALSCRLNTDPPHTGPT